MWLFRTKDASSPSDSEGSHLQSIRYRRGKLELLDQRKLPLVTKFIDIRDVKAGWQAIHDMAVRGAPAIAISAALSLAVDLVRGGDGNQFETAAAASEAVASKMDYLVTSRPTAVNLSIAAAELKAVAEEAAAAEGSTAADVVNKIAEAAEKMMEIDISQNQSIGEHGADALLKAVQDSGKAVGPEGIRVLTICNTGSLATAGYGTALGILRSLQARGQLRHAYACETRPYNQGSRLTAYEMVYEKMPATLLCDSAAPSLMAKGDVDAIVVGADRITVNGDTANKIGTSMLAVAAAHYGIPFFVAATLSTVDPKSPDGSGIPIEERSPTEVTHSLGKRVAAEGINVWNPGFDVTSGSLIAGIVTEKGCYAAKGAYDMVEFMEKNGAAPLRAKPVQEGEIRAVGEALTEETVRTFVAARKELADRIGPVSTASEWKVREVGDGNINFVYIVEGPKGGVCIKQALPFVRCVGESWPLTQDRLKFEVEAMQLQAKLCPEHVPEIFMFDPKESVMAMQYLAPPHTILRHSMNAGVIYPKMAKHSAEFLAKTLFRSSFLALPAEDFRRNVKAFTNTEMCALTEQVIFTEPLFDAANNGFLKPQMQETVEGLWADARLKAALTKMKEKFITSTQALLHGDVHTGSIMVSQDNTYFIDAEFAFYGPIWFDVGKFIGNLLLSFFSLDGRATEQDGRCEQRKWVVASMKELWESFSSRFVELWDKEASKGGMFPPESFGSSNPSGPAAMKSYQESFMKELFEDCARMAGVSMIRRIVGIAGVDDLRGISDADVRAVCECRALKLARTLLLSEKPFATIDDIIAAADAERQDGSKPYVAL